MKKTLLTLLVAASGTSCLQAQVNLNAGLVMYLPFAGNANDASGNSHDGLVTGATLTNDQQGHAHAAYYFNGVNASIRVPAAAALANAQFTVSAKVNMKGFYNGECYNNVILCKGLDRTSGSYSLRATQTIVEDCAFDDTLSENYRCDVASINCPIGRMNTQPYIVPGAWDCLVGTYDGDSVRMYVNGVLRYSYYEPNMGVNSEDLYIGRANPADPRTFFFKGIIDEVRLYDRVLSSDELAALCDAPSPIPAAVGTAATLDGLLLEPNPAQSRISVLFRLQRDQQVDIAVVDMAGRKVAGATGRFGAGAQQQALDLAGLSPGMYYLRIQAGDYGSVLKFLKQ